MATVSASLKLFDQFTAVLESAQSRMRQVEAAAESLRAALRAPITLSIDMTAALSHIETVRERIRTAGGSSALNIVVNSDDVMRQMTDIQSAIRSSLASAAVRVMLDDSAVLAQAAALRPRIEAELTARPIPILLDTSGVAAQLASIRSSLSMATAARIDVTLNTASVNPQLAALRASLSGVSSALRIDVHLNTASVAAQLAALRASLGTSVSSILVDVRLNTARVMTQAYNLKARILAAIGHIEVQLNLTLPGTITDLLTALRRLVLQLLWAVRRLRNALGGGPGGGGGGGSGGPAGTGTWLSNLKGIAAAYLSIAAARKIAESTIGQAMELGKMESMLQARLGSDQAGTAFFQHYKNMALKTGFDVKDALTGALSFMSMTKNTNQIDELLNISKRLAMFDTSGQGLSGAIFSTKEAMSGDMVSLAERFNINKAAIESSGLKAAGKSGDVERIIASFNKLLEMQSMGKEAFNKMLDSPAYKWQQAINTFKNSLAEAGILAMRAFVPFIDRLNKFFNSATFKKWMNELAFALRVAVALFMLAADWAENLYKKITNSTPAVNAIKALIVVLGTYWTVLKVVAAAQAIYTAALTAFRFAVLLAASAQLRMNLVGLANPYAAIVAGIAAAIIGLATLVATSDTARDHFKDLLQQVMTFANSFDEATQKAVNWTFNKIAIPGYNRLAEKVNEIGRTYFGRKEDIIKVQDPKAWQKALDDQLREKVKNNQSLVVQAGNAVDNFTAENIKKKAMELLGLKDDLTPDAPFDVEEYLNKFNRDLPNMPKVDVGTVDKVKNTVDISSEDLRVMRDLAEMKHVQNFVTLTPTVEITTGDINQPTSVDEMIRKIEEVMVKDIANSAKGVYGTQ